MYLTKSGLLFFSKNLGSLDWDFLLQLSFGPCGFIKKFFPVGMRHFEFTAW